MANRLSKETSPYLLQHKENPVDWYPWGKEALERARIERKPILLSIGYSACHWCHVMEHESFENLETANLMNENFVNIKVDREERPDLDQIYQNVAQALTRGGGWPLTVFLTPDLKPFFGGTYFPPDDRYGRPGFPKVLHALSDAFKNDLVGVTENAEKFTDFINQLESTPKEAESKRPALDDLKRIAEELLSRVDWKKGGLGDSLKFPNSMVFTFLWRFGVAADFQKAQDAAILSLTQMASGGIYDQLGGGFHRYSVDPSWSVPHFEKMLYDNALLLKLYSEVLLTRESGITKENRELYQSVLLETTAYLFREMTLPEGGFFSAQDADSEGEEGKYFAWDLQDLAQVLTQEEARILALRYGVTQTGNFEHGKTVLYAARNPLEVAQQSGHTETQVVEILETARKKLLLARNQRITPGLDNKVLTAWNGLMVSGLVWAAQALRKEGQFEAAEKIQLAAVKAFSFLHKNVTRDQDRLWSTFQAGKGKFNGYLDDYAFIAMAALDLSRFAKSENEKKHYLELCQKWVDVILKHFKDPVGPGYFFTSDDHETLIQRPKTVSDQAIPSGTAVALTCMAALAEIDWDGHGSRYREEMLSQLYALFGAIERNPYGMGELLCLSLLDTLGPVTVSGQGADALCEHPHVFQKLSLPHLDQGKLLVCHLKTCSLPLENLETARATISNRIQF